MRPRNTDGSGSRPACPRDGRRTAPAVGCGNLAIAGPGLTTRRGAGLHSITDAGCLSTGIGRGHRVPTWGRRSTLLPWWRFWIVGHTFASGFRGRRSPGPRSDGVSQWFLGGAPWVLGVAWWGGWRGPHIHYHNAHRGRGVVAVPHDHFRGGRRVHPARHLRHEAARHLGPVRGPLQVWPSAGGVAPGERRGRRPDPLRQRGAVVATRPTRDTGSPARSGTRRDATPRPESTTTGPKHPDGPEVGPSPPNNRASDRENDREPAVQTSPRREGVPFPSGALSRRTAPGHPTEPPTGGSGGRDVTSICRERTGKGRLPWHGARDCATERNNKGGLPLA